MAQSTKRFAVLYFSGCCLIMLLGVLIPSGSGPVVVIAKPWGAPAVEVVANADGRLMHVPNVAWFALADGGRQDFVANLYQSGAAFVASSTVAYLCARLTGTSLESRS